MGSGGRGYTGEASAALTILLLGLTQQGKRGGPDLPVVILIHKIKCLYPWSWELRGVVRHLRFTKVLKSNQKEWRVESVRGACTPCARGCRVTEKTTALLGAKNSSAHREKIENV